jgi:hydrogenase maturation protease
LADDGFGLVVAEQLRTLMPGLEVVETPESGFYLLDYTLGCSRLVVIDTMVTGSREAGTVCVFRESDLSCPHGSSPHYVGLFETLALGKALGLPVPQEVTIVAVEASDCLTIGGEMTSEVRAAIPRVIELVKKRWSESDCRSDRPLASPPRRKNGDTTVSVCCPNGDKTKSKHAESNSHAIGMKNRQSLA